MRSEGVISTQPYMDEYRKRLKSEAAEDLEATLATLRSVLVSNSKAFNEVVLLISQLNRSEGEWKKGLKLSEAAAVDRNRIFEATTDIIDQLRPEYLLTEAAYALHPSHRYTCDRISQHRKFKELFEANKLATRVHFFYLYGYYLQSHDGFFERIASDWEGKLASQNKPVAIAAPPACRVLHEEVVAEFDPDETYYKLNILQRLFEQFGIQINAQEPLLEKNIAWFQQKITLAAKLKKEDYVAVLFRIEEVNWDAELTPKITSWFLREFCAAALPDDSPTFLFFFAIIFETENSEVEKQVDALVEKSELLNALPELDMVSGTDVKRWLARQFKLFSNESERQATKDHYEDSAKFYMEKVEDELGKLIEAYNERIFRGLKKNPLGES